MRKYKFKITNSDSCIPRLKTQSPLNAEVLGIKILILLAAPAALYAVMMLYYISSTTSTHFFRFWDLCLYITKVKDFLFDWQWVKRTLSLIYVNLWWLMNNELWGLMTDANADATSSRCGCWCWWGCWFCANRLLLWPIPMLALVLVTTDSKK